jgi:hypothetical protein
MATVKLKKPVSKLKAGKKKKVNKWLILSGVAVVAIIGAIVVRFSSASSWVPITNNTNSQAIGTAGGGYDNDYNHYARTKEVTITKGHTYRVCAQGYGAGANSSGTVYFTIKNLNGSNARDRYKATHTYYKGSSTLHCSKSFYATQSYRAQGVIYAWRPQIVAQSVSIQYLK